MEVTQKIKNLLWPNDLSKCSEEALPHVRSLAKQYGAVVHVLYVAEDLANHESWYGEFEIDMVVMCRKGRTGNFDMGGVAQKVVVNSPVPVVIAPALKNK
jgi:nucleotide-binding universal stress UspA family protein